MGSLLEKNFKKRKKTACENDSQIAACKHKTNHK